MHRGRLPCILHSLDQITTDRSQIQGLSGTYEHRQLTSVPLSGVDNSLDRAYFLIYFVLTQPGGWNDNYTGPRRERSYGVNLAMAMGNAVPRVCRSQSYKRP
jgi:hypothetical protein